MINSIELAAIQQPTNADVIGVVANCSIVNVKHTHNIETKKDIDFILFRLLLFLIRVTFQLFYYF